MRYAFGAYLLDTACYELYHTGTLVSLRPKALEVLAYLVEHRDRVVSRQELLAQLWPDQVVGEEGLKVYIMAVRQALGDRGPAPRLLRTVRGRGYRFVAPLTVGDAAGPTVQPPTPLLAATPGSVDPPGPLLAAVGTDPAPRGVVFPVVGGEYKLVSALCCAVTYAKVAQEHRDLATLHRLMDRLQTLALDVVPQYEGRVHALLGDRVLLLFGVPVAREDDACRAVQAALALQHQFQAQQEPGQTEPGHPVALQMGLHTGVVIGEGQDDGTGITAIVGEVFSVAMALQEQAAPGQMLCSATTARLVHGMVRLARSLPVPLRGQPSPLAVHAVRGLRTRPLPGRRRTTRRQSPFVGRQREMATLHALLAEAEAGRGQVIGIVGEAGIGKSRLLAEFRRSLRQRAVTSLLGQCLSYGSTTPYLPVLRLLREVCGIAAADRSETLTARVTHVLQAIAMPLEPWASVLLHLLGAPAETAPLAPLSPEIRKARTLEALTQMCLRGSRQRPLLLAFEDLHWIDAASEEAMATLIEGLAGAPICLLATYRPGYRPSWLDKSYATQIALQPLTVQDSQRVVESVLATAPDPLPLVSQVLTQADGNPFFLEELAHTMLEQGPEAGTVAVPDTVQTVLRARLDRLPVLLRGLLQAAAVIGKEIPVPLLQALTDVPEAALSQALRQLQATEFLYAASTRAVPVYTFKHALTQEVTYASLLPPQQRQYHARLARVLVEQFPEMVAQQPAEAARHYTAAGLPAQAVPYWQHAGEQAVERVAMVEAVSHFTHGLDLLLTLPETPERHRQELTLCLTMVMPFWMLKGLNAPEVEHLSARAYALAQQWGDSRQQMGAIWRLGSVYFGQGRIAVARELVAPVLALAPQEPNLTILPVAHFMMGVICFHSGEFPAARWHFAQGRTLSNPQHSGSFTPVLSMDLIMMCLAREAWTIWMLGDADQAVALSQQVLALAQESGHPPSLAYVWLFAGMLQQCRRDVPRVLAYTDTLLALTREYGLSFFRSDGVWLRAWALVQQGGVADDVTQLQQAIQTRVTTEGPIAQPYILAHLAEAYGQVGQPEEGLRVVAEALAMAETHGEWWYTAELYRLHGELIVQQAQPPPGSARMMTAAYETAEAHFQQARALAQQQQARFLELRAVMSLSRLWHQQGNTTAAHALLAAACQMFTEGFETPDLCSARAFLDTLQQA